MSFNDGNVDCNSPIKLVWQIDWLTKQKAQKKTRNCRNKNTSTIKTAGTLRVEAGVILDDHAWMKLIIIEYLSI